MSVLISEMDVKVVEEGTERWSSDDWRTRRELGVRWRMGKRLKARWNWARWLVWKWESVVSKELARHGNRRGFGHTKPIHGLVVLSDAFTGIADELSGRESQPLSFFSTGKHGFGEACSLRQSAFPVSIASPRHRSV